MSLICIYCDLRVYKSFYVYTPILRIPIQVRWQYDDISTKLLSPSLFDAKKHPGKDRKRCRLYRKFYLQNIYI